MVYVLVELNGLSSMEKIDTSFVQSILSDLDKILQSNGSASRTRTGSIVLYSFTPSMDDLKRLFMEIMESYEYLCSREEELWGFGIFVDQTKGIVSKLQRTSVLKKMYRIVDDKYLYLSEQAHDLFSRMGTFEKKGDLYKVESLDKFSISEDNGIIEHLSSSDTMRDLMDAFTPLLNGESEGMFFCHGTPGSGLSLAGYCMSNIIEGKNSKMPWLYLVPGGDDLCSFVSVPENFNKDFLQEIREYFSDVEWKVWAGLSGLISGSGGDTVGGKIEAEEDAILLFKLYLLAYSRFLREKNFPVILYILDVEKFPQGYLDIVAGILSEYRSQNIITVVFSSNPDIPAAFNDFKVTRYGISVGNNSFITEYHTYLVREQKGLVLSGVEAYEYLMSEFDTFTRRILSVSSLLGGILKTNRIIDLFTADNSEKIRYNLILKDLVRYGFLYPETFTPVPGPEGYDFKILPDSQVEEFFYRVWEEYYDSYPRDPCFLKRLADVFSRLGKTGKALWYKLRVVDVLTDRRSFEQSIVLLKEIQNSLKHEWNIDIAIVHTTLFLKAALMDSRNELADDLFLELNNYKTGKLELTEIDRKIIEAEYHYSRYSDSLALEAAKSALIMAQNSKNITRESAVDTLMGKILFSMQRLDEARDYFRIARGLKKEDDVEILYLESSANYINGGLSESLRLSEKAFLAANLTGNRKWELLALFLKGRTLFDLGRYSQAAAVFYNCLSLATLYNIFESKDLLYIWIARALIYGGNRDKGASILGDYESSQVGLFFYAEYLYLTGDYRGAVEAVERALVLENDHILLYRSFDPKLSNTGFEWIEDLAFKDHDGHGALFQILKAHRAFYAAISDDSGRESMELEKLTRDGKLSDIDPHNGLYYFFSALSLPEKSGFDGLDRLTLLSKALRNVQSIASKIDDPLQRREFLNRNYWNSRLVKEGRSHKLI